MLDLDYDIESDMHRFHRVWIDIDQDEFGDLSAERLFTLIERLPAYDGALAARIAWLQEEEKKRNPSRDKLGPAGGAQQVASTAAGLSPYGVEVVQVGGEQQ